MILRKRYLSLGWYPAQKDQIHDFLNPLPRSPKRTALGAIAPHAGWFYSGKIAAASISALDPEADTVAVLGGHLPAGMPPLGIEEDGVMTPLGTMEIDRKFQKALAQELETTVFPGGIRADIYQDNTIEVLLPMVAYFFPNVRLVLLRLPAELSSYKAGHGIARIGERLGRKLVVLGSTDLTHYGDNYDFSPKGRGQTALDWVRTVNDQGFITAVQEGNPEKILERAKKDRSACSVGPVLGSLGFAHAKGANQGELLVYGTSADVYGKDQDVPESFVGYAAFGWYT
jgi:AmmeMemoRadiSam system protein B